MKSSTALAILVTLATLAPACTDQKAERQASVDPLDPTSSAFDADAFAREVQQSVQRVEEQEERTAERLRAREPDGDTRAAPHGHYHPYSSDPIWQARIERREAANRMALFIHFLQAIRDDPSLAKEAHEAGVVYELDAESVKKNTPKALLLLNQRRRRWAKSGMKLGQGSDRDRQRQELLAIVCERYGFVLGSDPRAELQELEARENGTWTGSPRPMKPKWRRDMIQQLRRLLGESPPEDK